MITLPDIADLRRIMQSLATLDLIVCPEWEGRFYSYDSHWSSSDEMASMRNGSGDEWFLLLSADGAAGLKGFAHESPAASIDGLGLRLASAVPKELATFSGEPAFSWNQSTFCYWRLAGDPSWSEPAEQAPLDTGASDLLEILVSGADGYCEFATDYYERHFHRGAIRQIFDHAPLSAELVATLNREISIDDIRDDLVQIGYPH